MSLSYEEFMKNLNSSKVSTPVDGKVSSYYPAVIQILKVEVVKKGMKDHPLLNAVSDEQPLLYVTMQLQLDVDGTVKIKGHEECGGLLTRKGELACYPTSEDGKYAGTLLYDIVHGCKEYSEEQKKILEGSDWGSKLLTIFKDMKFNMRAKLIEGNDGISEYVILETSRQKLKDKQYQEQKASASPDNLGSDLPF